MPHNVLFIVFDSNKFLKSIPLLCQPNEVRQAFSFSLYLTKLPID